jgi:hypothetical protein
MGPTVSRKKKKERDKKWSCYCLAGRPLSFARTRVRGSGLAGPAGRSVFISFLILLWYLLYKSI